MPSRHPKVWMMTDERQRDPLAAAARLPRGGGIVVRHYSLDADARRTLFDRLRGVAKDRDLALVLAGPDALADAWGADGSHNRDALRGVDGIRSAAVHSLGELAEAERAGANLLFVSPLHPTRSHPGSPALDDATFAAIVRAASVPIIALGGMTEARWPHARELGAYGWAAIDAWEV